jgi:hypothetical protein
LEVIAVLQNSEKNPRFAPFFFGILQSRSASRVTLQTPFTMTKKIYDILLDNSKIGTTELESADAPMGVVFGQISFININSGYDFFKNYCLTNNIELISNYPVHRLIATADIPSIQVVDQNGIEIKGQGTNIEGMDTDVFQVTILGIPYPFFEEEFPHHRKEYDNQFNDKQ